MANENIRSWILIELDNGKNYRYVRDVVYQVTDAGDTHYKGENGINYWWTFGDTAGDSWGNQGDSDGKVLTDYNALLSSKATGDTLLKFPENAGDTFVLKRRNYEMSGDTIGIECYNYTKIFTSSISDMSVINEKKPIQQTIG